MPPSVLGWGRADRCGPSGDAGGSRPLRRIRGGPGERWLVVCGGGDEFLPGVWTIVRQASRHPRASHSAADRRGRSRPPLVCECGPPGNAHESGANLLHVAVEHPEASGDRGPPAFGPELRVSADKAVASAPRVIARRRLRGGWGAPPWRRRPRREDRRCAKSEASRHPQARDASDIARRAGELEASRRNRARDASDIARYLPHATPGGPPPGLLRGRPRVPRGAPSRDPGEWDGGRPRRWRSQDGREDPISRLLTRTDVTGARAPARGGPPGRARSPPCRRPASRRSGG